MNFDISVFTSELKNKLDIVVEKLNDNLKKIQVGSVDTQSILDIIVNLHGNRQKIQQIAAVINVSNDVIAVKPWSIDDIREIEKAIIAYKKETSQSISITCDNKRILLQFDLVVTREKRLQLVKNCEKKAEESKVVFRSIRNTAMKVLQDYFKNKEEFSKNSKNIEEVFNKYKKIMEDSVKSKTQSLMR